MKIRSGSWILENVNSVNPWGVALMVLGLLVNVLAGRMAGENEKVRLGIRLAGTLVMVVGVALAILAA